MHDKLVGNTPMVKLQLNVRGHVPRTRTSYHYIVFHYCKLCNMKSGYKKKMVKDFQILFNLYNLTTDTCIKAHK